MAISIDYVAHVLTVYGDRQYGGEPVSQLEHALQCAQLAEEAGEDCMTITAALLHDIGHLLQMVRHGPAERLASDDLHQYIALPFLRGLLPEAVLQPIRLHVDAKRYLCFVDPSYQRRLSAESIRSLLLQGGCFKGGPSMSNRLRSSLRSLLRPRPYACADVTILLKSRIPGINLPDQSITPVYRSDSSGTTAVFTSYLAEVVPMFGKAVGAGKTANWPTGIGGKGNAGVAASVIKLSGAIGYVEYAFAKQNKMTHTGLINKAGNTIQPDAKSFAAAAAGADWSKAPGLGISLNNQAAADAWPITSASFILMQKTSTNPEKSVEVQNFFNWALKEGRNWR